MIGHMTGGAETAVQLAKQLHGMGRRIDDDVREITTSQSRWLFDLARSRFQRCGLRQDQRQALAFGSWVPLTDVRIEEGILVVKPRHKPAVRAEITEDASPNPSS
jgi:hypothetical protein